MVWPAAGAWFKAVVQMYSVPLRPHPRVVEPAINRSINQSISIFPPANESNQSRRTRPPRGFVVGARRRCGTRASSTASLPHPSQVRSGKHFLVYANGEVEWLALNSGYYQWQLVESSIELKVRPHHACSSGTAVVGRARGGGARLHSREEYAKGRMLPAPPSPTPPSPHAGTRPAGRGRSEAAPADAGPPSGLHIGWAAALRARAHMQQLPDDRQYPWRAPDVSAARACRGGRV